MFDWINDFIRSFLFSIAQLGGFIADSIFSILKTIVTLDIGEFGNLWIWYAVFMTFVGVFTIVRVVSMWLKAAFDEEYRMNRYKPFQAVVGVFLIMLTLSVFPVGAKYLTSVSQYAIENVGTFLNKEEINTLNPTTIVITSVVNGLGEKSINVATKNDKQIYTIDEIASKLNDKKDGKYQYLLELWHIFFIGAVIVFFGIGMILLSFQFVKRLYSIIMKIIIAPIPVSALVNNDSDAFGVWIKMLSSDLLTNFVQYLMLYVTILFATSDFIVSKGFFLSSVTLLGGLLFLLEGIPQLSQLIGGDTSTGGALQQLSTIRMATGGLGRGVGNVISFGAGAGLTAAAVGVYGAGRSMGAKSLLGATANTIQNSFINAPNDSNSKSTANYFNQANENQRIGSVGVGANDSFNMNHNSITKPNSVANKIGSYGLNNPSKKAKLVSGVSNVSRHLYEKSANRIATNKAVRGLHHANQFRKSFLNPKNQVDSTYKKFSDPSNSWKEGEK